MKKPENDTKHLYELMLSQHNELRFEVAAIEREQAALRNNEALSDRKKEIRRQKIRGALTCGFELCAGGLLGIAVVFAIDAKRTRDNADLPSSTQVVQPYRGEYLYDHKKVGNCEHFTVWKTADVDAQDSGRNAVAAKPVFKFTLPKGVVCKP